MSDSHTPSQKDRSLEKALTNNIVDRYLGNSESWLRAILRMCVFSITYIEQQAALLIECPNQAVAKRLSRKTYPLQWLAENLTARSLNLTSSGWHNSNRVLICYPQKDRDDWGCFDTETHQWSYFTSSQLPATPADS